MAISLSSLKSTKRTAPPTMLIYGVDGIGKTSWAAEFPDPIYLPTEGERPPSDVELATPGTIETFDDLLNVFGELLTEEHDRKTVIIDSLDGLEPLIWAATCARLGVNSIEEPGYGRGYTEADREWQEYLSAVAALSNAGMWVLQIAHPEIIRFDSPITDPYSRYSIKLHKRANALVREKADIVTFINHHISIKEKEVARQTKVAHAEGGKRRLAHFTEGPGFVAKNRYSLEPSMELRKNQGYADFLKMLSEKGGFVYKDAA